MTSSGYYEPSVITQQYFLLRRINGRATNDGKDPYIKSRWETGIMSRVTRHLFKRKPHHG